ncbi:hypothetical protein O181_026549 [Austropuccinia psidii MF-1]|uniref:DDE Tnp4 domain-containing protein n=1 Tax=Austropuccinia psidii MF-1 TaxID=1389203 RepID=A0A9Q3H1Q6_9BASI|nr:hypothetical protein [Austropuccinia psidii MF-1]
MLISTNGPGKNLLEAPAYPLSEHLIPFIKTPEANLGINGEFNYFLAKTHLRKEHVIGILKGKWESLKKMCFQFNMEDNIKCYVDWIEECCILHNILAQISDSWEELSNADKEDLSLHIRSEETFPSAQFLKRSFREVCICQTYLVGFLALDEY